MLEIIAVIFLAREIGKLAVKKGEKKGQWQLFTVLAWIGGEIIGAFIGVALLNSTSYLAILPITLMGGIGGYLIVRAILSRKPDADDNTFEFEKKSE